MSPKPQTTRNRIHGVLTRPGLQIVFVDLPGLHDNQSRAINRCMNRTALASLADSDVNVFVIEALRFTRRGSSARSSGSKAAGRPVILLVNKVDRARPRERLLPFVAEVSAKSATSPRSCSCRRSSTTASTGCPMLIAKYLPESPLLYPPDQLTDASERFMAAEIVREKLTLRLQDELPYGLVRRDREHGAARATSRASCWCRRSSGSSAPARRPS